eukprot:2533528-Prymnesium_polylepis.1
MTRMISGTEWAMTPVSRCLYSFLRIPDTDGVAEYITDHPGYAAKSAFVIFEGPILACVAS